jgi:hypothetical protein
VAPRSRLWDAMKPGPRLKAVMKRLKLPPTLKKSLISLVGFVLNTVVMVLVLRAVIKGVAPQRSYLAYLVGCRTSPHTVQSRSVIPA